MKKIAETTKRDGQETESLERVREKFDAFRINREKFGPLPEDMWESAVQLCCAINLSLPDPSEVDRSPTDPIFFFERQ